MKKNNILELIGETPVVKVNSMFSEEIEVWIKLEKNNPGGSIKDRIALSMIESAEKNEIINNDTTIIEPTSGNTGIGLAMVCAIKRYHLIIVMPESMSIERRKQMQAYGAEIVLTPRNLGMKGAIDKAKEIKTKINGWMPMQFENPANPAVHSETTAQEIINDFPEGIDIIIAGVGTGGHISGISKKLKKHWPSLKTFAVEPEESSVLSGNKAGSHLIQGIGAGFIPKNMDITQTNGIIRVTKDEAYSFTKKAALKEGLLVGISTGASLAAIYKTQNRFKGKKILTFAYDTGERYLSLEDLF